MRNVVFLVFILFAIGAPAQCGKEKVIKKDRLIQTTIEEWIHVDSTVTTKTFKISDYDKKGVLQSVTLLDNSGDQIGFTTYIYNKKGLLIIEDGVHEDAKIDSTVHTYDSSGRRIKSEHFHSQSLVFTDLWEYDEKCRITSQKRLQPDGIISLWELTTYTPSGIISGYLDSLTMWRTEFEYDEKGGQTHTYWFEYEMIRGEMAVVPQYNLNDQLVAESYYYDPSATTGEADSHYEYQYDLKGRKVKETYYLQGRVSHITSWEYAKP